MNDYIIYIFCATAHSTEKISLICLIYRASSIGFKLKEKNEIQNLRTAESAQLNTSAKKGL